MNLHPLIKPALNNEVLLNAAFLVAALFIGVFVSPAALAQIRSDPSAPGNQRPTVLLAPNGVPLVNIQTPSAAGVSRNTYSQFDVQPNGAILNNSRTDTSSQLGGWVQGNPWLATGSARVILNEVNSNNPSHLNGWVEVAGSRAQVVVANPAGISCNGCGFINASQTTLATGTPIVKSGSLDSYHIPAGELRIEGLGLDARETNVLTILARSAQVNAAIWAQRLKVITGKNDVKVDANGDVTSIAPVLPEPLIITPIPGSYPGRSIGNPPPAFALDTAYLGGMYAGHIFIVGTEEGLGTRNLGTFRAKQELTLSANGWLDVKGSISAPTLTLESEQLTNRGLITGQTVSVTSPDIKNLGTGRLYGDQLALQAETIVNAPETVNGITTAPVIVARDRLVIGTGTLENRDGALILSAGDAFIGRRVEALVDTVAGGPTLTATGTANTITNDSATIDIQGNAEINATTLNNLNSHLTTAQVDEAPFHTQRLLVARTNAMYPASQCWGLGGRGNVYCIVHPEVYGKRQPLLPVRTITECFMDDCGEVVKFVMNYSWNDPMFARFNVTPVGPPPVEPAVPYGVNSQGKPGGCTDYSGGPIPTSACIAWGKDFAAWDSKYQASLDALSIPLNAYNAGVNEDNRLHKFEDYTWYELTGSPSRTQVTNSSPALLRVGGDLNVTGSGAGNGAGNNTNNISSSTLTNKDSQIIVGGNINLADIALSNQETKGTYRVQYDGTAEFTTVETCGTFGTSHCREWHGATPYRPAPEITTIDLPTGSKYAPRSTSASTSTSTNSTANSITTSITSANNALFKVDANAGANPIGGYLVETDPAFTNYRTWLSSDYLLNALSYNPALMQKRLGDGYVEQSLIRDQVAQLTGRRFLNGYSNDEAQYLALLTNGKTFAEKVNLQPGIALTKEQIAQLTSDMVWLVEQTVTLADGSTTHVLVPQLYVHLQKGDLDEKGILTNASLVGNLGSNSGGKFSGSLISANTINANLKGDLTNSGTIAGRKLVAFNANNINNLAGNIQGADVKLEAGNDINNLGGSIAAENSLQVQAAGDINISSTTQSSANTVGASRFTRTGIDRVAGLYVTGASKDGGNSNANPTLIATAGNNLNVSGAQIINNSAGATQLQAGQDIALSTITTAQDDNAVWNAKNHSRLATSQDVGADVTTQGEISLQAGRDITARAANVTSQGSQGAITVDAARDIKLEAGRATAVNDQARHYTTSGTLSSTTTTTRDLFDQTNSVGTSFSGQSVQANAGRDVNVVGSTVVADGAISINAERDIKVTSATNTTTENHYKDEKTSGIMSSGGFGVTIGSRQLSNDQKNTRTTSAASTIGSLGTDTGSNGSGNVNLTAGRTYQQTGSDVLALQGDANITAQTVTINEARETQRSTSETKFKQSGITVAVSTPVLTAIQTVEQMSTAASNTSDSRMQALAAASSALAVGRAASAVVAGQGQTINGKDNQIVTATDAQGKPTATKDANAADKLGGITVSVSLGSSKSQSHSTQTANQAASSSIAAAGDVNIVAQGGGKESDILIQGSKVSAGGAVVLQAEDQLTLQAAANTAEQKSSNSSQSMSVGVGFELGAKGGAGVTVAGSLGRGKANGSDITWDETKINAGQEVSLTSGSDTQLNGAVVTAPKVSAEVGGNLTITSLQDTSTYRNQQQSAGGSITFGPKVTGSVNFANSNIKSDYASVDQQAGIRAGDNGFQVHVQGDTTLTGGAITSTDNAITKGKNSFTTSGQLTTSDINNQANYHADSAGLNIGVGVSPLGKYVPGGTSAGIGSDSGKSSSITRAGISDIAGDTTARTNTNQANTSVALAKIFDADKVQKEINAQVAITQSFTYEAGKTVNNYVTAQRKALQDQLMQTSSDGDQQKIVKDQLTDLNRQERVMNILISAVAGMGSAAVAKETLSVAAEEMRKLMIVDSIKFAGVTDGKTILNNDSGSSAGMHGDGKKLGGTRIDLDLLCGADNKRCKTNLDGSLHVNPQGLIEFKPDDAHVKSLDEFLLTPDGIKMAGLTGGIQGAKGTLFGVPYQAGSWQDQLVEAFAGTHDMVGGKLSGLYDKQGNATRDRSYLVKKAQDTWSASGAIIVSTPFAMSELLTPEMWTAISVLLKEAR